MLELYDTTLRDGSQGEGVAFSVEDKLLIIKALDRLGIHYIEGGYPGSNPKDMEFFKGAKSLRTPAGSRSCLSAARAIHVINPAKTPTC